MTRKSDPLFASTVKTPGKPSTTRRATVPCLSVLAHADSERIGERAVLKALLIGQPVELSRVSPQFGHPGQSQMAPLSDPRLSRSACVLRFAAGGSIELDPNGITVRVDGELLTQKRIWTADDLMLGVVIELGEQAVLLLHQCTARPLTAVEGLLGQSDGIEDVRRELLRVADLDTPVLLRGETGTGKEQIARALHANSKRAAGDYIAVNMATVPETVAISALFGHAKGAFTGAGQRHRGLFERADGGTLLLDEIGETPENVQPMLLRAVETGKILPLGDEVERAIDARFVAATDSDLERELRSRSFSAALLHRLSGYEIHSPPLRARREDIPVLLMHFLKHELQSVNELARLNELSELLVSSGFMARLVRHGLPGNVRQLRNVARHLVISNRGREQATITPAVERQLRNDQTAEVHPADSVRSAPPMAAAGARPPLAAGLHGRTASTSTADSSSPSMRPTEIDEPTMIEALRSNGWSPNRAAASLGIPTGTLHDLMRKSKVRRAADLSDDELRAVATSCGGNTQAMADALCVSERGLRITLKQRGLLEAE